MKEIYWDDIKVGDKIDPINFPLSVYRLIVAAGAVRDFNSIHHNSEYAKRSGAPDMYASTVFLLSMWERAIRAYIGDLGVIHNIQSFSMRSFNCAGTTVQVMGTVVEKWKNDEFNFIKISMHSENTGKVSVGPGEVVVSLPIKGESI